MLGHTQRQPKLTSPPRQLATSSRPHQALACGAAGADHDARLPGVLGQGEHARGFINGAEGQHILLHLQAAEMWR